jgi:hypothetical protein
MSKPLGVKQATKEHSSKKNPHMADTFAEKRHAKNAERPKQQFIFERGTTRGQWMR